MKRSVLIDIGTITFMDKAKFETLKQNGILLPEQHPADGRITNLGLFRIYILEYLKNMPNLNKDASLMVRVLQHTENGLPLEMYAFFTPPTLAEFEDYQALLFEHILAVLPEFGLKAFQRPSGRDMQMSEIQVD